MRPKSCGVKSCGVRCNSNTRSSNSLRPGGSRLRMRCHALVLAPGMSIVGNIECNGPAQVFGRIKGELRASDLLIGDGAEIEGSVIAQDLTVCGRVKGTIHAVRVKLQNGGSVEGDIFHRSLSIDENSLFEGRSRRVETQRARPLVDAKGPQETDMRSSALAPYLQRAEASGSPDWSESAVEPKH